MKRNFLLITLAFILIVSGALAKGKKTQGDELQRRSELVQPFMPPNHTTFPMPFDEINNVNNPGNAAASTGYYFVDDEDDAPDYWRPIPELEDTTDEPGLWRRILPGPRLVPEQYWQNNPDEGLRFFRNPAGKDNNGNWVDIDFFDHDIRGDGQLDSTDNAIAGPIPIGFGFYFNGLRYDSFYVSTNGVIALTNRRYFYDSQGERTIPAGATTCYDPMSMDWFARSNRTGNGLTDATEDDFGYRYAVCNNDYDDPDDGIRRNGGPINALPAGNKAAVIAPFWGSLHLSQFNPDFALSEDWGKAYFKRENNPYRLIVYYVNAAIRGGINTPYGPSSCPTNGRIGQNNYVAANAQVALNFRDSSIVITYENFMGTVTVSGRTVPAFVVYRYNTTVGVRGFARHVDYPNEPDPRYAPWDSEYEQYTHYFSAIPDPTASYPYRSRTVKFKQWQNSLRVVDIQYRVRKQDAQADLEFTEEVPTTEVPNYELLAGEERIGAIQPVALIQNLTNDIQGPQGVNFVPQELNFRARFKILNEATETIVYNRIVPVDSSCLAYGWYSQENPDDPKYAECTGNPYVRVLFSEVEKDNSGNYEATPVEFPTDKAYNGLPPYGFVQVYFPPFEPNEFLDNHIGRLKSFIIADPTDPSTGEPIGDQWPFDDTTDVPLFVMKRLDQFKDDVTEYHFVNKQAMPSVLKWVNIDADVTGGDDVCYHPLPPRGRYTAHNDEDFELRSPVIRLNRKTLTGGEPNPTGWGGDQIRSFPIDMRNRHNSVLSLSVQRTAKKNDGYPRGWSDNATIGPEPRTVVNGNPFQVFSRESEFSNYGGTSQHSAARWPDQLLVEYAQCSPDAIQHITNIDDKRWQNHRVFEEYGPDGCSIIWESEDKAITDMPALTVYGGGGYMIGFDEHCRNIALERPSYPNLNGLRPNIYDDGIDYEFKKYFVNIPDYVIDDPNEGAKNFRFRLRIRASEHKIRRGIPFPCAACIPDDNDDFFVDNVRILFPSEITDIEVSAVKIAWPYTQAPSSQAQKIPVSVTLSNNTSQDARQFILKVKIYQGQSFNGTQIYCRTQTIPNLQGGEEVNINMPAWNALKTGDGQYRLQAMILFAGGDIEPLNDTTYHDVEIKFGNSFAYDPVDDVENHVQSPDFTGISGRGLNLFGYSVGGVGNLSGYQGGYDPDQHAAGYVGGNGSGQIAMKFRLLKADTIYGYEAYFAKLNQAPDAIAFAVYTDQSSSRPADVVDGSVMYTVRGSSSTTTEPTFGEYITYELRNPVVLAPGTYWVSIAQMGETGMELGASKERMGMRTLSVYINPLGNTSTYGNYALGGGGLHLMIEKTFRKPAGASGNLINDNLFAYENTRNSGTWREFMPSFGNPAYPHLDHFGRTSDGMTLTLSRGTWIPMIRPYLGPFKTEVTPEDDIQEICPDDVPVELVDFNGDVLRDGINLYWETASETDNYGFYVERSYDDDEWKQIGFVKGNGNSSVAKRYHYSDSDVDLNNTYSYRLRQIDKDGTQYCHASRVITLTYDRVGKLYVDNVYPNPFNDVAKISFNTPQTGHVNVAVYDVYGNVVKTLVNEELSASNHVYDWDGYDENGNKVANGTYIFKITAGEEVQTGKLTLVK